MWIRGCVFMTGSIVFASNNEGKIRELKKIFGDYGIKVLSMKDVGFLDEIEEIGSTFLENAVIKAEAVYSKIGGMVLADDSGLEVDYLNNAPGVFSSRFAATDEERIGKLLNLLEGVPREKRTARFVCNMVLLGDKYERIEAKGVIDGYITERAHGKNGFGYDPVFYLPDYEKTMAEVSCDIKNKISHRAKALNIIIDKLKGCVS